MTRYGPHRPEDAPATVTVYPPRGAVPHQAPVSPALLAQRQQINTLAHKVARAARRQERRDAAARRDARQAPA